MFNWCVFNVSKSDLHNNILVILIQSKKGGKRTINICG